MKQTLQGIFIKGYRLLQGKLVKDGRWCVPLALAQKVATQFHDQNCIVSSGFKHHWDVMTARCMGPDLKKAVETCVQECGNCCIHKPPNSASKGHMQHMPIPTRAFRSISMDFFSFPRATYNDTWYDQLLLIVCQLSGYIMPIPMQKEGCTGEKTAKSVLSHWMGVFGVPTQLITDRGPQFISAFFNTFCTRQGILQHKCMVGRHKGNGKAEVTGKGLRTAINKARTQHPNENWVELLTTIVQKWNAMPGPSGYSPNEILFGRHLDTSGVPYPDEQECMDAKEWLDYKETLEYKAIKILEEVRGRKADQYNKHHLTSEKFAKGDQVLVRNLRGPLADKNRPHWEGPHVVHRTIGHDLYEVNVVDSNGVAKIIEVASDSLWKCPQIKGPQYPLHFTKKVAKERQICDELERYPVEKILDHYPNKNPTQFLAQWQGWDRSYSSWVPASDFFPVVNDVLQSYVHRKKLGLDVAQLMHSTGRFRAPT